MNFLLQAKGWSIGIAALMLAGCIFAFPQQAIEGVQQGLERCYTTIIPTLFPFFVIADLFLQSPLVKLTQWLLLPITSLLKIPKEHNGFLLTGWVAGFAASAASIGHSLQKEQISQNQAAVLLTVSTAAGPSFVIGAVGYSILGNVQMGIFLYLCQLIACVISTFIMGIFLPYHGETLQDCSSNKTSSFPEILTHAVSSTLNVCGYVVFFQLLYQLLPPSIQNWPIACLLEMTLGCNESTSLSPYAPFAAATSISLLGICAFAQISSLTYHQVSLLPLLASRLFHLPILLGCFYAFLRFVPISTNVWANSTQKLILPLRMPKDAALIFFLFAVAVCCSCRFSLYRQNPEL